MLTDPAPDSRSGLRTYVLVSITAFLLVGLYLAWVFYSRWQQNQAIDARAAATMAAKKQADAERVYNLMGGNRFAILNFYANPSRIEPGETADLCYSVSNAKSVKLEPQSQSVWPALSIACKSLPPRPPPTRSPPTMAPDTPKPPPSTFRSSDHFVERICASRSKIAPELPSHTDCHMAVTTALGFRSVGVFSISVTRALRSLTEAWCRGSLTISRLPAKFRFCVEKSAQNPIQHGRIERKLADTVSGPRSLLPNGAS
jgi:hypothetical protein